MTLRARTLLASGSLIAVLIGLVFVAAGLAFQGVADQGETESMQRDLSRLNAVWGDSLQSLDDIVKHWATWDDAYAFVADRNNAFEQANLLDETFQNLRVDVILFVDTRGRLVFGKAYTAGEKKPADVPPELLAAFGPGSRLLQNGGHESRLLGPLQAGDSTLLVSAHPILNSDASGPNRGTLIMARKLNVAHDDSLSQSTQLNLSVFPYALPDLPADVEAARVSLDDRLTQLIVPLDDQRLAGYMLMRDIRGEPGLILRVIAPRSLRALSNEALRYFLLALGAFGAFTIGVLLWQLEINVLRPLARIDSAVGQVSQAADSSVRVPVVGSRGNEVARLAETLNTALAALDQSHRALADSEARYRLLAETVPDVVYTLGLSEQGELVIETLNPAFEHVTGFAREEWLGRSIADLVHPDDLPRALGLFGSLGDDTYYLRIRTRDGGYRIGSFSSATRVNDGVPTGSMGIARDVTDRLRLEALLQAVAFASERFLRTVEWEREIDAVLARLGAAGDVSRAFLCAVEPDAGGEIDATRRSAWCNTGIAPPSGGLFTPGRSMRAAGLKRWVELLSRGEPVCGPVRSFPPAEREALAAQQTLAVAVMPVFAGSHWWGFVGLEDCAEGRDFEALEQEALRTFAGALGAAIQRGAVEAERARDRTYLALINEVTRIALVQPDARAVAQLLADKLHEFIEADHCYVTRWDESQRSVVLMADAGGRAEFAEQQSQPNELTLSERILRHAGPLIVPDTRRGDAPTPGRTRARSILGLPLSAGVQWLGAAIIAFNELHEFTPDEIRLSAQVAEQFSLVLARIRLQEESNRRAEQLKALHETATDVSASRDTFDTLEKIVQRATSLLASQSGGLYLADPPSRTLRCVVSHNAPQDFRDVVLNYGEGAAGTVAETGRPLIIDDYTAWSGRAREDAHPFEAVLSVPLMWHDKVTGVLHVLGHGRRYSKVDIDLISLFAEQASITIENARLFEEVQKLAITDELTGAHNRRELLRALDQEIGRTRRINCPLSVAMLDLDHFKAVNDQYGHAAGDQVLRAFAERVRAQIRVIDILARYGGEEFVIVMPETDGLGAQASAERLRQAIAGAPFHAGGINISLTASIGIAQFSAKDTDGSSFLSRADFALYDAKRQGRNRAVLAA